MREAFQNALQQPEAHLKIQFRYQKKDGEWRHLELVGQNRLADPDAAGIVTNCRDVTDRWRAEEELRDSEKQYRLLFQGNPNPMWVFDLETLAFLEVNESGHPTLRLFARRISGDDDVGPPPDWKRTSRPKMPPWVTPDSGHIWRHRRKDGSIH